MRAAVVVGGIDMMTQALVLAKKPHVVIGLCINTAESVHLIYSPGSSHSWEAGGSFGKYKGL